MRLIVVAACVVGVIALTQGEKCTPDYCKKVDCSQGLKAEECPGSMVPHTSECGCCPTCVQFVPLWSECDEGFKANTLTGIRKECSGLSTCFQGRCVAVPH